MDETGRMRCGAGGLVNIKYYVDGGFIFFGVEGIVYMVGRPVEMKRAIKGLFFFFLNVREGLRCEIV